MKNIEKINFLLISTKFRFSIFFAFGMEGKNNNEF